MLLLLLLLSPTTTAAVVSGGGGGIRYCYLPLLLLLQEWVQLLGPLTGR